MKSIKLGLAVVAIVAAAACASGPKMNEPGGPSQLASEFDGAPKWVNGNCARYLGDKKIVCAMGTMSGTRNPQLARDGAMSNGRAEIASMLKTEVQKMVEAYANSAQGGKDFKASSDEAHTTATTRTITEQAISGSEMEESWISKSGSYYVLVVLDVEKFMAMVNSMAELDAGLKAEIARNAEKAFDNMDKVLADRHK